MRKLLLLVFVIVMAFILVNRERVYVRDPLARVYRNDVKQSSVQVFINYTNDVLLDGVPGGRRTLVQGWNKTPGTPVVLKCMRWMACLADADRASTIPMEWTGKGKYEPRVTMTGIEISFLDGDGGMVHVELW